jgi:hypothetical protein
MTAIALIRRCWLALLFAGAVASKALVIVPTWDPTITNDPNAAAITNSILSAIQFYEARFSTPITVTIRFEEMSSTLIGHSSWWYYNISYSQFRTALAQHAVTANDAIALANLPIGSVNPVTQTSTVRMKTANLRALGFTGFSSGLPGGIDGVIGLKIPSLNLSRTSISPSKYDLVAITEHEIDEVLGLASALDSGSPDPLPEDLFRYDSSGNRTYTTVGDDAYFSLNGTDLLARFNQDGVEDFGDWWTAGPHTPHVQDAYLTGGVITDANVELVALDAIGYTLVDAPPPKIATISKANGTLTVQATNGMATGVYKLLASDQLSKPLTQWSEVSKVRLVLGGSFTLTAPSSDQGSVAQFYILLLQ